MNRYSGFALFLSMFITVGCSDFDEGCDESNSLKLAYDWSSSRSLKSNDNLIITSEDGNKTTIVTDNVGTDISFPEGVYIFFAYESTPTVALDSDNFSVKVDESGNIIELEPFSAGWLIYTVQDGGNRNIILPMFNQTRELIVRVNFTGVGLANLTSIDGYIDNVTASRKVTEGFPPADGKPHHAATTVAKANYNFTLSDIGSTKVKQFIGSKRLLGIDGATLQTLNLVMHYTGGKLDEKLDVTSALELFHIDKVNEPFVIELTINIDEDFSANIEYWRSGSISIVDAN